MAFSPDGSMLASGSRDKTIRLWDTGSGQLLATLAGHADWINGVAFSPTGHILASRSRDGTIRLWDANSGQLKAVLLTSGYAMAFSPDGSILASGNGDGMTRLWDTDSGQLKATLEGTPSWGVISVAFSPDGSTLASGDRNDDIRLWDVARGQLLNTLYGHREDVRSVAFSPDGGTLASGSDDETIRLWDVGRGQLKAMLEGHTGSVNLVAFSPDGSRLASRSRDGTTLLWDMLPYVTLLNPAPKAIQASPPLPTQTALLANFPNPFNPETWLPFQLHAPAPVRLSIYDVRGALIREIDLGYREAGPYLTSANAAYWDGRDQHGQRVASGVYLYRLQAGPVAHVRKMILIK